MYVYVGCCLVILSSTDTDYCIYPGCRYEKEFYGAQFCSEDHLEQASDEGNIHNITMATSETP